MPAPTSAGEKRLVLHPYRLCLVKQAWYLIARPEGADHPRTYRVARFRSLGALDSAADVPDDFDLRAYFGDAWAVYRGERSYEVEVRFVPEASVLVTETTWHHTQQVRPHEDGSVTLSFRVDGLEEVVWWVLGWTGRAEVVKPPELRAMVVEQLRRGLALNGDGEGQGGRSRCAGGCPWCRLGVEWPSQEEEMIAELPNEPMPEWLRSAREPLGPLPAGRATLRFGLLPCLRVRREADPLLGREFLQLRLRGLRGRSGRGHLSTLLVPRLRPAGPA